MEVKEITTDVNALDDERVFCVTTPSRIEAFANVPQVGELHPTKSGYKVAEMSARPWSSKMDQWRVVVYYRNDLQYAMDNNMNTRIVARQAQCDYGYPVE